MHPVVIRVEKLTSAANIGGSGAHTWREMHTPNADPARTPQNEDWRDVRSSQALRQAVADRVALATEKAAPGARPVLALEYVITANALAFQEHGGSVDSTKYFRDALAWLEQRHGADNVVAVNIQRDERAPHMVAYVVPLVEVAAGKRRRSVIVGTNPDGTKRRETREYDTPAATRLSAQHFMGSRDKLRKLQTDFAAQVGQRHGLARGIEGSRATHQTVKEWYAQAAQHGQHLTLTPDDLQPRVKKKGLIRSTYETPEEVAQRLTTAARKAYTPAVARAKTMASERRRAAEMGKTAQGASTALKAAQQAAAEARAGQSDAIKAKNETQAELQAYQSIFTEGLTPDQQQHLIAIAQRTQRQNKKRIEQLRQERMTPEQRAQEAREEAAFQRSLREAEAEDSQEHGRDYEPPRP